jgi:integrase/recombinase XerD
MSAATDGTSQNTKKLRFTLISAFFNFVKNSLDSKITNPCDNPALRKLFRAGKFTQLKILEKDAVDEIIFRTSNQRNRLILELMARSGMRVGEVLKLKPMDIDDRKAIIRDPKSGKEAEVVFLPQKVADRLRTYIREKGVDTDARIFPLSYAAARLIVKKAGNLVSIHVRPHDLRYPNVLISCVDMLPLMHHVQAHPWKLCQRYCCAIRIYQPLKGTWVKSVMLRPCGGLTTCMGDPIYGRAEDLFSARLFQRAFSRVKYVKGIHCFSGL